MAKAQNYSSYDEALKTANIEKLSDRRERNCIKFINKNVKSDISLLKIVNKTYNTRSNPGCVHEYQCRTKSFFDSGMPYLERLYINVNNCTYMTHPNPKQQTMKLLLGKISTLQY